MQPRAVVVGAVIIAALGASGCSNSAPTSAPVRTTTTTTTTTTPPSVPPATSPPTTSTPEISIPPFTMETCGQIITNPDLRPSVDHTPLLMTSADVPSGYVEGGPKITTPSSAQFVASVPSTSPVVYTAFSLSTGPPAIPSGTLYTQSINETIGDVGSTQLATEMVTRIQALWPEPQCSSTMTGTSTLALPGSLPNLMAYGHGLGAGCSDGLLDATVLVAKGPYVINIMWASQVNSYRDTQPSGSCTPPLPSASGMVSQVDTALSLIPS